MKPFFCLFFLCLIAGLTAAPAVLRAQSLTARQGNGLYVSGETGEEAIAARYFEWARAAVQEKRFSQAEAFLIRAADYASVSSDLSYLLAVVKKKLFRPERDVLTAARLAMETNRWSEYSRLDALYLEAETLIRMRRYNEAVNALSVLGGGDERAAELRAAAMYWLPDEVAFETAVAEA
ncbi:MAG: hypothetical protein LBH18_07855, partial [Spirochaetaceae bacterium]|nr:hypothetical protein [Spirochaetaceae bacterium]